MADGLLFGRSLAVIAIDGVHVQVDSAWIVL